MMLSSMEMTQRELHIHRKKDTKQMKLFARRLEPDLSTCLAFRPIRPSTAPPVVPQQAAVPVDVSDEDPYGDGSGNVPAAVEEARPNGQDATIDGQPQGEEEGEEEESEDEDDVSTCLIARSTTAGKIRSNADGR